MNVVPRAAVVVFIISFLHATQGAVSKSKGLLLSGKNGTIQERLSRLNTTHPAGIVMLTLEIAKGFINATKPVVHKPGMVANRLDNNGDGMLTDVEFYQPTKRSSFLRLKEVSTHSLYFVAAISLLVLLLMIIKLAVSRRERTKEYNLVTKGDFEA